LHLTLTSKALQRPFAGQPTAPSCRQCPPLYCEGPALALPLAAPSRLSVCLAYRFAAWARRRREGWDRPRQMRPQESECHRRPETHADLDTSIGQAAKRRPKHQSAHEPPQGRGKPMGTGGRLWCGLAWREGLGCRFRFTVPSNKSLAGRLWSSFASDERLAGSLRVIFASDQGLALRPLPTLRQTQSLPVSPPLPACVSQGSASHPFFQIRVTQKPSGRAVGVLLIGSDHGKDALLDLLVGRRLGIGRLGVPSAPRAKSSPWPAHHTLLRLFRLHGEEEP